MPPGFVARRRNTSNIPPPRASPAGRLDAQLVTLIPWRALTSSRRAASDTIRRMAAGDWKVLVSTFVAVFVAELGDKTQLATLSMSSGSASKWAVFGGSALALCTTSAIAVLAGGLVTRVVSPFWLRRIAGGVFILLGALFVLGKGP